VEVNLAQLVLGPTRHDPHRVAIRMGTNSLTYGQLDGQSERVAAGLRELGIGRGDRVMMFAENSIEHLVSYVAVARLGAIFTPIHPSYQADELTYVLGNSTPRAVIADPALLARLARSGSPDLPSIQIVLGSTTGDAVAFDRLGIAAAVPVGSVDVDDDEPVLICYTSGSTDRPQPVTRSHAHEIWNAQTYADVSDYRADDRALVAMPLSWVWGLSTSCQALLSVGATVVLNREFDAGAVLDEIESSRITLFAGTMSMLTAMLHALNERPRDVSSLRHLYRGGEPINDEIARQLESRTGLRLLDAYATTEAAPVLVIDPVRDPMAPRGTAGRLVTGALIRLVDTNGADVPHGEVGEAWLGGRGIMLGYWNEPEMTSQRVTPDGWFRSGDLLVEDADGYFYVVGRTSDVIIRNGAKIAPAEVESALSGLAGVRDSIAVGVPDEEFGESIVAFVVLEPGSIVSVDDIYAQLSDRIARFKIPSDIQFVDDLPLRRNEKRDRRLLRQQAVNVLLCDSPKGPDDGRPWLHIVN
jgi:long-chain acyl-CoA synthetase